MKCFFSTALAYFFLVNLICAQDTVRIRGTWENGPKSIWLNYFEDVTTAKSSRLISTIDSINHTFEFHFELKFPTILRLANEPFIVIPGDTVYVNIFQTGGEPELTFEGPKQLEHSFLIRLYNELGVFRYDKYLEGEKPFEKFRAAATLHFDSSLHFLESYFAKQKATKPFQTIAIDFLTIQYYSGLVYPVTSRMIQMESIGSEYFDSIDSNIFDKTNLLGFREFILLVSDYNNMYSSVSSRNRYYDSAAVGDRIQSANIHFEGEVKDHLLLFTFTNLIENGVNQNVFQLKQLYDFLIKAFADDPARIIQIQEHKNNFDMLGKPFPEEILAQRMKTKDGKEISLKEVLSSHDVFYIDFWASWCGPCLQEMPVEKQLISEFRGKKVKFILISLDENEKKWKNAMAKINVNGEHYIINENFNSVLVRHLDFDEIPRYIIIDDNGILISRNAPRPHYVIKNKSVLLSLLK